MSSCDWVRVFLAWKIPKYLLSTPGLDSPSVRMEIIEVIQTQVPDFEKGMTEVWIELGRIKQLYYNNNRNS